MLRLIMTGLPFHFWLIVIYVLTVGVFSGTEVFLNSSVFGSGAEDAAAAEAVAGAATPASLEQQLDARRFDLPLFGGAILPISMTTIFIVLGFLAQWVEAIRATRINRTGGNDLLSVLIAFGALLAFAGVGVFQTTAFLVVVIVGFGDIMLDRIIGQAVARRDFGAIGVTGHE